jgi:membrane protein required for colicin V production
MNILDIVIIVIVGFCLLRGAFRGIVKEVSSIVGVLAGFYGAYTYYKPVAGMLASFITSSEYQNIAAFLVIFGGVFAAVSALGILIKMLLKVVFLGWVDRLCGAVFGFLKGVMICSVILMALTSFLSKNDSIVKNAKLAPFIAPVSQVFAGFSSREMNKTYMTKIHSLRDFWEKKKSEFSKK